MSLIDAGPLPLLNHNIQQHSQNMEDDNPRQVQRLSIKGTASTEQDSSFHGKRRGIPLRWVGHSHIMKFLDQMVFERNRSIRWWNHIIPVMTQAYELGQQWPILCCVFRRLSRAGVGLISRTARVRRGRCCLGLQLFKWPCWVAGSLRWVSE